MRMLRPVNNTNYFYEGKGLVRGRFVSWCGSKGMFWDGMGVLYGLCRMRWGVWGKDDSGNRVCVIVKKGEIPGSRFLVLRAVTLRTGPGWELALVDWNVLNKPTVLGYCTDWVEGCALLGLVDRRENEI